MKNLFTVCVVCILNIASGFALPSQDSFINMLDNIRKQTTWTRAKPGEEPQSLSLEPSKVYTEGSEILVSGQLAERKGQFIKGKVFRNSDITRGREAAELCALNVLNLAKQVCPEHKRISCKRLQVYINSGPFFKGHLEIANAASTIILKGLGNDGMHTRDVIGVVSLPSGSAVQISGLFKILPELPTAKL